MPEQRGAVQPVCRHVGGTLEERCLNSSKELQDDLRK